MGESNAIGRVRWKGGVGLCALLAVALALVVAMPSTAFAARSGSSDSTGNTMNASWTVPTSPMTSTVTKDGKQYKVISTWAMAWSTSGPDFLGINNSSFYGNGGNGNAKVDSTATGSSSTLLGIWASDANESPNAYNWNSFYNLYASENNKAQSDTACTSDSWDTSSGVYGPFKYRPEIIWLCNNLNATQTKQYVGYINSGKYVASDEQITSHTEGEGRNAKTVIDSVADPTAEQKASFYVDGDETYNPIVIQPDSSSPYTFVQSTWKLAEHADTVIANTANAAGLGGAELTWKSMNKLPRSNRYTEDPDTIAMNIERLARGSVYYTLHKINDGTVARKKVAYVTAVPGTNENIDSTHATVVVYDYTEDIMGGGMGSDVIAGMGGTAGWSPLTVDQLGADGKLPVYAGTDHVALASGASNDSNLYTDYITNPTATYSVYLATADDLLSCDVIYAANSAYKVSDWQTWLSNNATTAELKAKATTIPIAANTPYVCNGSNYTMDKLIYSAYAMDFLYPELFGNMENSAFWYNKVYHVKGGDILKSALTWGFANATAPAGTSLASLSFDAAKTIAKYDTGLAYFNSAKGTDATLKRVLANTALNGSTSGKNSEGATVTNAYTCFEPTAYWASHTTVSSVPAKAKAAQPMTVKAKTATVKYSQVKKKQVQLAVGKVLTVKKAQGAVTYAKANKNQVKQIVIAKKTGKVTVKKGIAKGTYKIKVKVAAAGNDKYEAGSKTVTMKIKVA